MKGIVEGKNFTRSLIEGKCINVRVRISLWELLEIITH